MILIGIIIAVIAAVFAIIYVHHRNKSANKFSNNTRGTHQAEYMPTSKTSKLNIEVNNIYANANNNDANKTLNVYESKASSMSLRDVANLMLKKKDNNTSFIHETNNNNSNQIKQNENNNKISNVSDVSAINVYDDSSKQSGQNKLSTVEVKETMI